MLTKVFAVIGLKNYKRKINSLDFILSSLMILITWTTFCNAVMGCKCGHTVLALFCKSVIWTDIQYCGFIAIVYYVIMSSYVLYHFVKWEVGSRVT